MRNRKEGRKKITREREREKKKERESAKGGGPKKAKEKQRETLKNKPKMPFLGGKQGFFLAKANKERKARKKKLKTKRK